MKTHTRTQISLAALAAGALLAFPAVAQPQPTQTVPLTQQQMTSPQTGMNRPLAGPQANQMMSSDLRGTTVYGMNNENIGEINDLLLERDGRVAAVIVGVGGFLGIGEKDVAVPFTALEIQADNRGQNTGTVGTNTRNNAVGATSTAPGMTGAGTTGTGMTGTTTGVTGTGVTGTGVTGTGAAGMGTAGTGVTGTGATGSSITGSGVRTAAQGTIRPQRVVLRGMTRADLENAPAFDADGVVRGGATGTTGVTTGAPGAVRP